MVTFGSLTVLPGSPDTPQFVQIRCRGLDSSRFVELLVNNRVHAIIPVNSVGGVTFLYTVPAGPVRNALADLNFASGRMETVDRLSGRPRKIRTIARCESALLDSIELRYQV